MKTLYNPEFVERLFDDMSASYNRMNYITSFGFSKIWRRQCVQHLELRPGTVVVDLMTGMGECWPYILRKKCLPAQLIALDFSTEMVRRATAQKAKFPSASIRILKENVFQNSIPDGSADHIISGFGLKTFDKAQLSSLAAEINRILRPGGTFSMIDVSVPKNRVLQLLYMFYLKRVIPVLGSIFLGNPETYRMLGIYTEAFGNARKVEAIFAQHNFDVEYLEFFWGCASGIKGRKHALIPANTLVSPNLLP
ncbi:MAG: class I SAM-dependent methyltransferase [Saprospiraceae bacterium]|nr:class I SAM-dependent methyltransferase [Saprospiraceae bacterium]